jgi:hypothetical protein
MEPISYPISILGGRNQRLASRKPKLVGSSLAMRGVLAGRKNKGQFAVTE